ncbi:MAG: hypothetical protein SOZ62_02645 [Eubacteriales bacterium]|nr:hypothetical protein [Eubacteriales bacterium]
METEENVSIEPSDTESSKEPYTHISDKSVVGDRISSGEKNSDLQEETENSLTAYDAYAENEREYEKDIKGEKDTVTEDAPDIQDVTNANGEEEYDAYDEERLRALAYSDLSEIRSLFPENAKIANICEINNPIRYATLREIGLSVKEAYLATNGIVKTNRVQHTSYDNRSHIVSAVPRQAISSDIGMSRSELEEAKQIFGNLTEKEIRNLYRRAKG